MKRTFAFILSVVLFFSITPFNVFAFENDSSNRDRLISDACKVFPEYSDKILNNTVLANEPTRYHIENEPIINLSRSVSESQTMTYTEYSNGTVLLSNVTFGHKVTYVDQYTSSIVTNYTINIEATCSESNGYFEVRNVKYAIVSGQYDSITSTGTPSSSGNCSYNSSPTLVANETASGPAYMCYELGFRVGPAPTQFYASTLMLTVRNNVATVTHTCPDA